MTVSERPGVYTSYEISGVSGFGGSGGTVGIAAEAKKGTKGNLYDIVSYGAAVESFGDDCAMTELIRILILNGVSAIKAAPLYTDTGETVPSDNDYKSAFKALAADGEIKVIICDSHDADVHGLLKSAIAAQTGDALHKFGITESGKDSVSDIVSAAKAINSERMVLVAPYAVSSDGTKAVAGSTAAVAGAVLSAEDPAVPINGAVLQEISGLKGKFSDTDITSLVRGGVTPVEYSGGEFSVIRGITTKTLINGVYDSTWRELTTLMIVDDVIPTVRDALKAAFTRTKNTVQTRGAIRTRVMIELEKKLAAEIIDSYSNVTVGQNGDDPTVCDVSFEFGVAHGLNQIRITAYITV